MTDFYDYAQGDLRFVYSEIVACFNDNQIKIVTWDGIPYGFRDLMVEWLKETVVNYDPHVKKWQTLIFTQPYIGPNRPDQQMKAHAAMNAIQSHHINPTGGFGIVMKPGASVPDIQYCYRLIRTYKSNFRRIGRAILSMRVSDNQLVTNL